MRWIDREPREEPKGRPGGPGVGKPTGATAELQIGAGTFKATELNTFGQQTDLELHEVLFGVDGRPIEDRATINRWLFHFYFCKLCAKSEKCFTP